MRVLLRPWECCILTLLHQSHRRIWIRIRIRTNGSGSGMMDPDPGTDRNESTNVPISKLRIETKPKCFDVFQNPKWNVSVYSKNFGTKPKLFDVFQLLFCKSKTFVFSQKILEQNQNFLICSNFFLAKTKRYYIIQKILYLKENVLVR